jgi:hypothetical protein
MTPVSVIVVGAIITWAAAIVLLGASWCAWQGGRALVRRIKARREPMKLFMNGREITGYARNARRDHSGDFVYGMDGELGDLSGHLIRIDRVTCPCGEEYVPGARNPFCTCGDKP